MASYVKDNRVWSCPADSGYTKTGFFDNFPFDTRPSCYDRFGNSYGYYTELGFGQYPASTLSAISQYSLTADRSPSTIIVLGDATGAWHGGSQMGDGRYCSVFVDGHAKSLTQADYMDAYDIKLMH